jgi:hypothetical protein
MSDPLTICDEKPTQLSDATHSSYNRSGTIIFMSDGVPSKALAISVGTFVNLEQSTILRLVQSLNAKLPILFMDGGRLIRLKDEHSQNIWSLIFRQSDHKSTYLNDVQ